MIGIFRKNDVINIVLLLPYTILLRLYSFIHPKAYIIQESDTVFSKWFFSAIDGAHTQSIIALCLVYSQAIIINLLANNHRLHRTPSALAGMFYILIVSAIPQLQILCPALIATSFLLIAIYNVFRTYKLAAAASNIFNAALASSAAALIYPPYVFAIIALFIGLSMMRNFKMVERLQFIVGYAVLLWIVGVFLFFVDLLNWDIFSFFSLLGTATDFSFADQQTFWNLGIGAFLVLIALMNYYNYMKKKGIDIRKKIDFFYWLMFCSVVALFLFRNLDYQHYYFLAVSLSLFISMAFLFIGNKALAELLHISLLVGIFYNQFM